MLVHLLELGHDRQDDIRRIKGDVRQEHRDKAALNLGEDEEQHQRNAGNDIGHGVGDVRQRHHKGLRTLFHAVDTDGGEGAEDCGDDGGQDGNAHGDLQGFHDGTVLKQIGVPMQGEAFPLGAGFAGVEGLDDQHADG